MTRSASRSRGAPPSSIDFRNVDGVPLQGRALQAGELRRLEEVPADRLHLRAALAEPAQLRQPDAGPLHQHQLLREQRLPGADAGHRLSPSATPGQSALKCVLPAIDAVVARGFVDRAGDRHPGAQLGRVPDRLHGHEDHAVSRGGGWSAGGQHDVGVQRHSLGLGAAAPVPVRAARRAASASRCTTRRSRSSRTPPSSTRQRCRRRC